MQINRSRMHIIINPKIADMRSVFLITNVWQFRGNQFERETILEHLKMYQINKNRIILRLAASASSSNSYFPKCWGSPRHICYLPLQELNYMLLLAVVDQLNQKPPIVHAASCHTVVPPTHLFMRIIKMSVFNAYCTLFKQNNTFIALSPTLCRLCQEF